MFTELVEDDVALVPYAVANPPSVFGVIVISLVIIFGVLLASVAIPDRLFESNAVFESEPLAAVIFTTIDVAFPLLPFPPSVLASTSNESCV